MYIILQNRIILLLTKFYDLSIQKKSVIICIVCLLKNKVYVTLFRHFMSLSLKIC